MKQETLVVLSKGLAYMLVGAFTPWIASLAQWSNSGDMPPKIIWLGVILPASVVGGASAWISFTSSTWGNYQQQRKADISGQDQVTTIAPTVTVTPKATTPTP